MPPPKGKEKGGWARQRNSKHYLEATGACYTVGKPIAERKKWVGVGMVMLDGQGRQAKTLRQVTETSAPLRVTGGHVETNGPCAFYFVYFIETSDAFQIIQFLLGVCTQKNEKEMIKTWTAFQ